MNNILTEETFLRANAIWSAQQALKTGSEVETFCNAKMKRNHQIIQGHYKFAKSRLKNIEQAEQSGKTITDLIHSHGIYVHCLLLDTFSPISFAIAKEYHNAGSIIDRPSVQTKHNSIDLSKTVINKFVNIIGLRHVLGTISHLCSTCQKQHRRFFKRSEGPTTVHQLSTVHGPWSHINMDLGGPYILNTVRRSIAPRGQPTTKLHVVVAVCSLTKAVCMTVINGTGITAISQGLQAVFSRVGVPHGIWTDRQSGLSQITKSGTILTDEDGFKVQNININYVPTGPTGYSFNGAAERKIRNLKQALGSLNMSNTDLYPISFNNIILHLEQEVNSIPIGKRAQEMAMQETTAPNYSNY